MIRKNKKLSKIRIEKENNVDTVDKFEKVANNFVEQLETNIKNKYQQRAVAINSTKDELEDYIENILDGKLSFKQLREIGIIRGDYIQVSELDKIFESIVKVVTTKREQCQLGYSKAVALDLANMRAQTEKLKYIVKTYCPQDALVDEMFKCP